MPSNYEMPPYEEWKQRRANRPFGEEVVILEVDPKEEMARRKARDQRLMSLLKPEEQDSFYAYLDHCDRVQAKVEQDRGERERRKAAAARQASADAEKRRKEQHTVQKRLERVALNTDKQFTKEVAKSKYYQLVQQERQLRFKSGEERDQFWLGKLQSEGLLRQQHGGGAGGAKSTGGGTADAEGGDGADDEAAAGDEGGAGSYRLVWEKAEDALQVGAGSSGTQSRNFHAMSRAQQNRLLEELFPRVERPKLASFDVDYSPKQEKSAEELELERLQERRRRRLEDWREHRHMQQMAVTFGVATRRILDERPVRDSADRLLDETEGDLGQLFGGALERARRRQEAAPATAAVGERELDLTDPRLIQSWRRPRRRRRAGRDAVSSASATGVERPLTTPASRLSDEDESDLGALVDPSRRHRHAAAAAPVAGRPRPRPLLSLEQAHNELPSVEAKGHSTLWSNYLGAGNVRFAPLDDDQWYRTSGAAAATT